VDAAFGQSFNWNVVGLIGDSANWKIIDPSSVQAGDVVTIASDHVEIVDHYDKSAGKLYVFGSHQTGSKTGPITTTLGYWDAAYRYIGSGGTP
jgi:hypothetical protein